ncbi:MAG TPA: GNAT family N-acetyltransferase, partial [Acetobacteraceae bacterium]|nr:GNAT family N-acetyltransferase [Acetobacteraceae bacterium]
MHGGNRVDVIMRPAAPDDAPTCGQICYAAFGSLADHHGFPRDFPSVKMASDVLRMLIEHAGFYGVVAERDGKILGSNFMDERSAVLGIGPISVDPAAQDKGIGRSLMLNVLDRATARHAAGVRLVQAAYHNRSLCLYTKLGFQTKEPLSVLQGPPIRLDCPGYTVRAADPADIEACNALCTQIHGFDRGGELRDAVQQGSATVVERLGRITGYATLVGFFGHSVAETDQD